MNTCLCKIKINYAPADTPLYIFPTLSYSVSTVPSGPLHGKALILYRYPVAKVDKIFGSTDKQFEDYAAPWFVFSLLE